MKRVLTIMIFLSALPSLGSDNTLLYKKVFKDYDRLVPVAIPDPISKKPINRTLLKVVFKKKIIGFIREITTTTGCNSECLPLIYTSFYDKEGKFLKILSAPGLTKINHTPFTKEDYSQLDLIVTMEPQIFKNIAHPKQLTDALSGATLKKYDNTVISGAAYTTLRVHLYNLQTKKFIKSLKH